MNQWAPSTSSGTCLGLGGITGLLSNEVLTMMTFESSTHGRTGVLNITINELVNICSSKLERKFL